LPVNIDISNMERDAEGIAEKIRNRRIVLLDGAMGTELAAQGVEMGGKSNLLHPGHVRCVHDAYCRAGADILITNTLTMNRIYIEHHKLGIDPVQVNLAGVRLAREAASQGQSVFGDISSTGQFLEPYGEYTEEQFFYNFREQAGILYRGGVNGFIIETVSDLREAACALRACRDIADIPVLVSLSFSSSENGGYTMMGNTVEETVKMAEENGASAIGANCGELDPLKMADLVKLFNKHTSLPVLIQPNAGKPELLDDGTTAFNMGPGAFADELMKCIDNGATLIGGCCGTTPRHMAAVARKIGKLTR
jgi:5-methyltetrahydrofolate--homocysteine methyltransferase